MSYRNSNIYPGPIRDFGGQTRVTHRQKRYGRAVGTVWWCFR
jgi:hypothetical protein